MSLSTELQRYVQNDISEESLKKIADIVVIYHNDLRVESEDFIKKSLKSFQDLQEINF